MRKRAAVMIGRFQPPHLGHYVLLNRLKKHMRAHPELELDPVPVIVVVAGEKSSRDKARNPLSANERISFMGASGYTNGVKFVVGKSAIDGFKQVQQAGYEPVLVAAGSDRGENYKALLDRYFSDTEHHMLTMGRVENPPLEQTLQHLDKDLPISLVTGSLVRLAVTRGELDKFKLLTGLREPLASKLFNRLSKAMEGA